MIIGLTGNSGSGKSTVAKMFELRNCRIIDCDKISHDIDDLPEYKDAVMKKFGAKAFDKHGDISRRALGKIAFSDAENLSELSKISHPIIKNEVMRQLKDYADRANIVVDAPLLFEGGLDAVCDLTIGVIADDALRLSRVISRDGILRSEARKRIFSQKDASFYRENCNFIIENNGDISELRESFCRIAEKMGI